MSKGNRLKEKKEELAKKKKDLKNEEAKAVKEMYRVEVVVDENESIRVFGPIDDPLLIMKILAGAMNAIVDHNMSTKKLNADIEAGRKEKEKLRIIKP